MKDKAEGGMKEVTMIITCEITVIEKVSDEEATIFEVNKDSIEQQINDIIKSDLVVDDVNIIKNQIFIRDAQD